MKNSSCSTGKQALFSKCVIRISWASLIQNSAVQQGDRERAVKTLCTMGTYGGDGEQWSCPLDTRGNDTRASGQRQNAG